MLSYLLRKAGLPQQRPSFGVSGVLEAWLSYILLHMDLGSMWGGSGSGAQLTIHPWPRNDHSLSGQVTLFSWVCSFGRRHLEWWGRTGAPTITVSLTTIPSDQWGDQCHRQSPHTLFFPFNSIAMALQWECCGPFFSLLITSKDFNSSVY